MSLKIVTAPEVFLVGKQMLNQVELDRFLSLHGVEWSSDSDVPAEVISESAGRVCYMSFAKPRPGGNSAYLEHIKKVGHGSVLEHAVWNFVVTGVSRSLTHELVRHRAGFGYSQLSQRYVDESEMEAVVPPDLMDEVERAMRWLAARRPLTQHGIDLAMRESDIEGDDLMAGFIWLRNMLRNGDDYKYLTNYLMKKLEPELARRYKQNPNLNIDDPDQRESDLGLIASDQTDRRKAARGTARSVLPNATETKITITANARALRHFLEQRGSKGAEVEIRRLANALLDILVVESPNLFGDYVKARLPDGTFQLTTPYPKV